MAQAHLAAAGFDDPIGLVESLYLRHLPSEEAYDKEVAGFEPHFDRAMNKSLLLKLAEQQADGDADVFRTLVDHGGTRSGSSVKIRAALLDQVFAADVLKQPPAEPQDLQRLRAMSRDYADGLSGKPAFNPARRDDYYRRFVDAPLHIHEMVYQAAYELAVARLKHGGR
jgi:hypothetical protein